jgi:hypothetical protein
MKNTNNKLESTFINIFRDRPDKKLTVTDIKGIYLKVYKNETGLELDAHALRAWLYRKIYKMLKRGDLIKSYENGSSTAKYQMIESSEALGITNTHLELGFNEVVGEVGNQDILKVLKEKEAKYKIDLHASIGESDEYKKMCESYPLLKTSLITEYEESRNKRSILTGRLAATRKVISQFE